MNYAIHRISLDVNNDAPSQLVLSAKRGDSAKLLIISLLADKHNYIINEGCYATLTGKKRDGAVFEHECAIDLKNNKIEYPFQPFTVSKSGVVDCEVNIFNTYGERLTTSRFTIIVYETIFTDAIEDAEDDITAVTQLRADLNELIQTTEKKLENGEFVGEKGDKGDKGDQGEKGDTGATGAKILSTELIGQDTSGGNVYKQTFDNGSTAEFTAPKGEKGDKGERGEQGIQGIQGEKGERGEQGIQGIQGVQGEAAIALTIGEVTTGDVAKVENVGTPTEPILNITLPRGEKGATGDRGASAGLLYEHRIKCRTEAYYGSGGNTWNNIIIHITSDKPDEYSGSDLRQYFNDRGYTAISLDDGSWQVNATYPVMVYNKEFSGVGSPDAIVAMNNVLYLRTNVYVNDSPWRQILTASGYVSDFVTPLNPGDSAEIPQIDNTLTQEGFAADAKATGDRLKALEENAGSGEINLENGEAQDSIVQKYSGKPDATHKGNTNTGKSAAVFGEFNSNTESRTLMSGKMNNSQAGNSIIGGLGNGRGIQADPTLEPLSGSNLMVVGSNNQNKNCNGVILCGTQNLNEPKDANQDYKADYSIVGGFANKNRGISSIIGGGANENNGSNSFMVGYGNYNNYNSTITAGEKTINSTRAGIVAGKYNDNKTNTLIELGNGTDNEHRSNAFEVTKDGIARAYGTPVDDNDVVRLKELKDIKKLYRHRIELEYTDKAWVRVIVEHISTSSTPYSTVGDFVNVLDYKYATIWFYGYEDFYGTGTVCLTSQGQNSSTVQGTAIDRDGNLKIVNYYNLKTLSVKNDHVTEL